MLPSEVTGHQAILEFSRLLVSEGQEKRKIDRTIDPSKKFTLYEFDDSDEEEDEIVEEVKQEVQPEPEPEPEPPKKKVVKKKVVKKTA